MFNWALWSTLGDTKEVVLPLSKSAVNKKEHILVMPACGPAKAWRETSGDEVSLHDIIDAAIDPPNTWGGETRNTWQPSLSGRDSPVHASPSDPPLPCLTPSPVSHRHKNHTHARASADLDPVCHSTPQQQRVADRALRTRARAASETERETDMWAAAVCSPGEKNHRHRHFVWAWAGGRPTKKLQRVAHCTLARFFWGSDVGRGWGWQWRWHGGWRQVGWVHGVSWPVEGSRSSC